MRWVGLIVTKNGEVRGARASGSGKKKNLWDPDLSKGGFGSRFATRFPTGRCTDAKVSGRKREKRDFQRKTPNNRDLYSRFASELCARGKEGSSY